MNIATDQLPFDYRSQMQARALDFLRDHQGEHLVDEARLLERAIRHLVHAWEVPLFMAPRLVQLAVTELQPNSRVWVGIDLASGPDSTTRHRFT